MLSCTSIKNIFGENLRKLRKIKGLKQEQLAEIINLDYKTISAIETGKTFVSGEVIARLCNVFNVEPVYFFKKEYYELSEDEENIKTEINRLLSNCKENELKVIYKVIVAIIK